MITQDQLKDVTERTEKLRRYLRIDEKQIEWEEEDLRTQAPDFWDDPKRAEAQMKKVKAIKKWIDGYNEVRTMADELQLAFDFYREEMVTEQEVDEAYQKAIGAIESLELMNMLRQEEDPMDAVLKINSGAGGTEAQDWASMLMRMYMRCQPVRRRRGRHQECHHADRGRRVCLRLPEVGKRCPPLSARLAVQCTGQAHDVVRLRIRHAVGRRYH